MVKLGIAAAMVLAALLGSTQADTTKDQSRLPVSDVSDIPATNLPTIVVTVNDGTVAIRGEWIFTTPCDCDGPMDEADAVLINGHLYPVDYWDQVVVVSDFATCWEPECYQQAAAKAADLHDALAGKVEAWRQENAEALADAS